MLSLDLDGRTALVTGGAAGIGAAIAGALVEAGAEVTVVDAGDEPSDPPWRFVRADVADRVLAGKVVDDVRPDILINNAGITRDAVSWKMTEEQWDRVLDVNLKGSFHYASAALPWMREGGWGRIVNVASINGLRGKFGQTNYCASKAGLIGLTKALAREAGRFGVTVNAVAPGMTRTAMTDSLDQDRLRDALEQTVLERLADPHDIAGPVVFLCSELARHVTGVVLRIDGGQAM